MLEGVSLLETTKSLKHEITRHCVYDSRNKRLSGT